MPTNFEIASDYVKTSIAALLGTANTYLTNLQNAASPLIVEGTTVLPEQYDYNSVPNPNLVIETPPLPPSLPDLTGPSVDDVFFSIAAPSAVEVPVFLESQLLAPTSEFSFYEGAYQSILLDPVKVKLLDNLLNGGYGIETSDEIALFNRARDREVEAAMTRVDDAGRAMASRGFPLPPGELSIHVDRAYQDMQNKVSGASRDITLERSKLYVDNRQFTIREIRDIEQITIGFHNSVQERALNVARAVVEVGIAVYNAKVAEFSARLRAAEVKSAVALQNMQIQLEQARLRTEVYRAQVMRYEADTRRQIEGARIPVEIYRGGIDRARVVNDALVARASLTQKVIEATRQQNIQIDAMTVENAKARIQGVTNSLAFKTRAVEFAAEKFFAQLTALQSAIATLDVRTETAG